MRVQDIVAKLVSYEGWINMFDSADAPMIDKYISLGQKVAPSVDDLIPKLNALYKTLEPLINKIQTPEIQKAINDVVAASPDIKVLLPQLQAVLPDLVRIIQIVEANQ